ncbi:uncharacterized protein JCM6883_002676 [Sporobolomyces salmoneus]|uniref:uncharacterized protein n=1 Tax=Sporobolomyces salmoneus TaxID=183962 RepID=UPI003175B170
MPVRPRTAPSGSSTPGQNLAPDLFVLVRPPPGSHNHPLNLQIQLLVPSISRQQPTGENLSVPGGRRSGEYSGSSSRAGSFGEGGGAGRAGSAQSLNGSGSIGPPGAGGSAVSFDAIAGASVSRSGSRSSDTHDQTLAQEGGGAGSSGAGGESLRRTNSRGSTRSRGSTNSVSTTASGTPSRRRVTPLLNLNFHSVLPTVVTDAGTDQRVAKFLKRGIEMSNLAIIDPIDLSQPPPPTSSTAITPQNSPPRATAPPTVASASNSASTPTNNLFSKFKRFTLGSSPKAPTSQQQQQQSLPSSTSASSFSLFSRSTSTSSNLSASSPTSTKFLPSLVSSEGTPTPRTVPLLRTGSDDATNIQSPVSATSPPPKSPSSNSTGTLHSSTPAVGYAFVVRKWLRDDLVQVSEAGGLPSPNTTVRLEWVRASDQEYRRMGKKTRSRSRSVSQSRTAGMSRSPSSSGGSDSIGISASRRSSEIVEGIIPQVVPEDEELQTGMSTSPNAMEDEEGREESEDEGESSDPEDSERPFICTLLYPSSSSSSSRSDATASSPPSSSSMSPSPSLRRLQLATLRPAPHHPKLISTLLLPPTLPSIPLGSFSPDQGLQGGVLSNETLRDLVHVTSMFISIREGLGGLGKENQTSYLTSGLGLTKVGSGKVGRTLRGLKR